MKLDDLLGAHSRDTQHLEYALGNLLAHCLKSRVRAGLVQFCDDIGDCLAHAGYFAEPFLRDYGLKRKGESAEVLGRPAVGTGAIRVAAAQFGALAEFLEQI